MKGFHPRDGGGDTLFEVRGQTGCRRCELRRADLEYVQIAAIEFPGLPFERWIAFPAHFGNDPFHRGTDIGGALLRRTRQGHSASAAVEGTPLQPLHGSIFSMGSTSMALAPAALRFSSVSQNTDFAAYGVHRDFVGLSVQRQNGRRFRTRE